MSWWIVIYPERSRSEWMVTIWNFFSAWETWWWMYEATGVVQNPAVIQVENNWKTSTCRLKPSHRLCSYLYIGTAHWSTLIYLKLDKNCHIRVAGPNWGLLGNPLLLQRLYLKLLSFPRAEPSAFSDCSVENLPVHYVLSYMRTSLTYDKEPFPLAAVYMWKEEERFKHFLLSDESPVHCFIIN